MPIIQNPLRAQQQPPVKEITSENSVVSVTPRYQNKVVLPDKPAAGSLRASSIPVPAAGVASNRNSTLVAAENSGGTVGQSTDFFSEEKLADYCLGGYHPVAFGDVFNNRYKVIRKLGFGKWSTVWLVLDLVVDRHFSLKICTADISEGSESLSRAKTLQYIRAGGTSHPGYKNNVEVLDIFTHQGPHGLHICLILELMYQDLSVFARRGRDRKIPLIIVKEITRQLLSSLDYLHTSCEITHTDIQAQNILLTVGEEDVDSYIRRYLESSPPKEYDGRYGELPDYAIASEHIPVLLPTDPSYFKFKLAGLGMSAFVDKELPEYIQLPFFRAPEVIIGAKWGKSADIWNLGCIVYELLQGRVLFWGKADKASGVTAEEDHLCQMMERFGPLPLDLINEGKHSAEYFDGVGCLAHIKKLYPFSLEQLLRQWSPDLREEDVIGFAGLLKGMLQYRPGDRMSARELLDNTWLQSTPYSRNE